MLKSLTCVRVEQFSNCTTTAVNCCTLHGEGRLESSELIKSAAPLRSIKSAAPLRSIKSSIPLRSPKTSALLFRANIKNKLVRSYIFVMYFYEDDVTILICCRISEEKLAVLGW